MRPLIGITCQPALNANSQRPMYGLGQSYVHAVEIAGGIPLLIPPMGDGESLRAIAERLDGILLSGGGDVDPTRYGEEPIPQLGLVEPERDALELALARIALDDDQPLFGICRGMQTLNVAQGGTLYQDIGAQQPKAIKHDYHSYEGPRDLRAHRSLSRKGRRWRRSSASRATPSTVSIIRRSRSRARGSRSSAGPRTGWPRQ